MNGETGGDGSSALSLRPLCFILKIGGRVFSRKAENSWRCSSVVAFSCELKSSQGLLSGGDKRLENVEKGGSRLISLDLLSSAIGSGKSAIEKMA